MDRDPRYPVGKFVPPTGYEAATIAHQLQEIAECPAHMRAAVAGLTDAQLDTPYREGGWTVRQVTHHIVDSHLNAYCRFKLALTEDNPAIKPYDEAAWAELPDSRLPVEPSLRMLETVHIRWLEVMRGMSEDDWNRTYVHPEHNRQFALWWVAGLYAWHSRHHVAHVTTLRTSRGW